MKRSGKNVTPLKVPPMDSDLQEIIQTEIQSAITTPISVISNKKPLDTVTMSERKLLKIRRVSFSQIESKILYLMMKYSTSDVAIICVQSPQQSINYWLTKSVSK